MITCCAENGAVCIELRPETAIERVFVAEMLAAAEKGRTVSLSVSDSGMVVAVPK